MATNRFMQPTRANYFQTYVDQYVPLPFELMQKRAQEEQQKYDTVQSNGQLLMDKISEDFIQTDRNPLLSEKYGEVEGSINSDLEKHNGDWRKLQSTVSKLAQNYKRWITTGKGAIARENKGIYVSNLKAIDESNMPSRVKEMAKKYAFDRYNVTGGAINDQRFESVQPYELKDFPKKMLDVIKTMDPDQKSVSYAGYSDDGNLIVDFYKDSKGVAPKAIQNNLRKTLYNDPEFDSMVGLEYQMDKFYGNTDDSYDEYKNKRFNSMFRGEGFAYKQDTERTHAKESAQGRGSGAKRVNKAPVLTSSGELYFGKNEEFDKIAKSDNILTAFEASYANDIKSLNNQMFETYRAENPGTSLEEFRQFQTDVAKGRGLDLGKRYDQRMFLEGVANGTIPLDSFAKSEARRNEFKEAAKQSLKNWQTKDQMKLDVLENAANQGIIPLDKYEKYRDGAIKLKSLQKELESRIASVGSKEEREKTKKAIRTIEGLLNKDPLALKGKVGDIKSSTLVANSEFLKENSEAQKAIKEFLDPLQDIQYDLTSEELKTLEGSLKERLSKNIAPKLNFKTSIPTYDDQGNLQDSETSTFIRDIGKTIKENKPKILAANVRDPETGEVKNLETKLWEDAGSLVEEGKFEDVKKAYKHLEKKAFESGVDIANSFNPETGNYMIRLGDEYVLDLSDDNVNFDFSKVPESVKSEMTVNTYVTKALKDGVSNSEVAPGVYIQTKEPDQITKADRNFDQQWSDGKHYRIRVDNGGLGGGKFGQFVDLPAEKGRKLILQIEKMKRASSNGKIRLIVDNEVKELPLDEAIKKTALQYARS